MMSKKELDSYMILAEVGQRIGDHVCVRVNRAEHWIEWVTMAEFQGGKMSDGTREPVMDWLSRALGVNVARVPGVEL